MKLLRNMTAGILCLLISLSLSAADVKVIEWDALLPENERGRSADPPAPVHDYLGEGGRAATQAGSFNVNKQLDGVLVKIPGFIAPLALSPEGEVSEFFLVPYFGACIHVPPPPPNQLVYVKLAKPLPMDNMYEAYWITGTLRVKNKTSRLGISAYAIEVQKMEVYKF